MRPALLLVDLQQDYLHQPNLHPPSDQLVRAAASLLALFRDHGWPVIHGWTTIHASPDRRMPHWRRAGVWRCVEQTPGHAPPSSLQPREGETIVPKTGYNVFESGQLKTILDEMACDTLVVAGVQLHACVRTAVTEAHGMGLRVIVADDAVASEDALHAAVTRRYLAQRDVSFRPVAWIARMLADQPRLSHEEGPAVFAHHSPRDGQRLLFTVPDATPDELVGVITDARHALEPWQRTALSHRRAVLDRAAGLVEDAADELADLMVDHIGKPVTEARLELAYAMRLLRYNRDREEAMPIGRPGAHRYRFRARPLGVVALITPWNNPVAVPLGKIAPALFYGNAAIWKPAPAAQAISEAVLRLLHEAGVPGGLLGMVHGGDEVAQHLAAASDVNAVTMTGSDEAGYAMHAICARRRIPFQGEFGGNNAAIVCADADLPAVARSIASAAFGFAGQRCTANRRVIVEDACYKPFTDELLKATAALYWGDPCDRRTVVGPLITATRRDMLAAMIEDAVHEGLRVDMPHRWSPGQGDNGSEAYLPPAVIHCDEPRHAIVQEESFGPIAVIQRATHFSHAIELANDVRQGLAAALFTEDAGRQTHFLAEAEAGMLKINRPTTGADADRPFGGWKTSGLGPAEHGPCDREFYTRTQAVYWPDDAE